MVCASLVVISMFVLMCLKSYSPRVVGLLRSLTNVGLLRPLTYSGRSAEVDWIGQDVNEAEPALHDTLVCHGVRYKTRLVLI